MEQQLAELKASALARVAAATTAEQLEAVRVEVAGRKGTLAELGKVRCSLWIERMAGRKLASVMVEFIVN